jgi:hypothetical protein
MSILWRTIQSYRLDASREEILDALANDVIFVRRRPAAGQVTKDAAGRTFVDPRGDEWLVWRAEKAGVATTKMMLFTDGRHTWIDLQVPRLHALVLWGLLATASLAALAVSTEMLPPVLMIAVIVGLLRPRLAATPVVLAREVHRVLGPMEAQAALGPYRTGHDDGRLAIGEGSTED